MSHRTRLHHDDLPMLGARPLGPGDPERLGPYRLCGLLGAGGMGRVYLGWGESGYAAIKAIKGEFADRPDFRARFARELGAIGRLDGAYTARLLYADPDAPVPWMATEYVPGIPLSAAVAEFGPLPADAVWRLVRGIGAALAAIHTAGLVHRDLKPSNVLLAPDGPRIIDFGISHASDLSRMTQTGQPLGTPAYMAPEQADGRRQVTSAADLFALGGVVVLAATGEEPFGAGHPAAVMHRVLTEDADLERVEALDPGLAVLAARCLEKEPDARPGAEAVVAAASVVVGMSGEAGAQATGLGLAGGAAAVEAALTGQTGTPFLAVPLASAPWPEPLHTRIQARATKALTTMPLPDADLAAPGLLTTGAGAGLLTAAARSETGIPVASATVLPAHRSRRRPLLAGAATTAALLTTAAVGIGLAGQGHHAVAGHSDPLHPSASSPTRAGAALPPDAGHSTSGPASSRPGAVDTSLAPTDLAGPPAPTSGASAPQGGPSGSAPPASGSSAPPRGNSTSSTSHAPSPAPTHAPAPPPAAPCNGTVSTGYGTGHTCAFWPAGDGHSGSPVLTGSGATTGYLHQGTNWVLCQAQGRTVHAQQWYNDWWAWTLSDYGGWGWVNAVDVQGGGNDGQFGNVPQCNGAHGSPPH